MREYVKLVREYVTENVKLFHHGQKLRTASLKLELDKKTIIQKLDLSKFIRSKSFAKKGGNFISMKLKSNMSYMYTGKRNYAKNKNKNNKTF